MKQSMPWDTRNASADGTAGCGYEGFHVMRFSKVEGRRSTELCAEYATEYTQKRDDLIAEGRERMVFRPPIQSESIAALQLKQLRNSLRPLSNAASFRDSQAFGGEWGRKLCQEMVMTEVPDSGAVSAWVCTVPCRVGRSSCPIRPLHSPPHTIISLPLHTAV